MGLYIGVVKTNKIIIHQMVKMFFLDTPMGQKLQQWRHNKFNGWFQPKQSGLPHSTQGYNQGALKNLMAFLTALTPLPPCCFLLDFFVNCICFQTRMVWNGKFWKKQNKFAIKEQYFHTFNIKNKYWKTCILHFFHFRTFPSGRVRKKNIIFYWWSPLGEPYKKTYIPSPPPA